MRGFSSPIMIRYISNNFDNETTNTLLNDCKKNSKIFLYDEPAVQEKQISNLKNFLLETFPVDVEIKECIFHYLDE